jgi:hypothetical protein
MLPKRSLGKEKRSQLYFLFWNFLPVHVIRSVCGTFARTSQDQRREVFLLRNVCGPQAVFSGNQQVCRANAPGRKRHKSGTIPATFSGLETLTVANCPRVIKLTGFN